MLKNEIQEFVSMSSCRTKDDMIARDRECEIDLDTMRKRKSVEAQVSWSSANRPKGFDSRSRGQQAWSHCGKCSKVMMRFAGWVVMDASGMAT